MDLTYYLIDAVCESGMSLLSALPTWLCTLDNLTVPRLYKRLLLRCCVVVVSFFVSILALYNGLDPATHECPTWYHNARFVLCLSLAVLRGPILLLNRRSL